MPQANASALVMLGVAPGYAVDRRFLAPAGGRTMCEIERERYAVKALRDDFDEVPRRDSADAATRVAAALAAVDR